MKIEGGLLTNNSPFCIFVYGNEKTRKNMKKRKHYNKRFETVDELGFKGEFETALVELKNGLKMTISRSSLPPMVHLIKRFIEIKQR